MLAQARASIERMLGTQDYDRFFDEIVGSRALFVPDRDGSRLSMFPPDPRETVLASFGDKAPRITSHAANPSGPVPGARPVADAEQFARLIDDYHARGYTVRIPEVGSLFPALARFLRALEESLLVAVDAEIFWSAERLEAPVHYDNSDIIAIQLYGAKEWFVSSAPSSLPNPWNRVGEIAPQLHQPQQIAMAPGDFLYLPRGTPHTVRSTSESLHLSIGFTPLTIRDAIAATLDHMTDLNRPLRASVTPRADDLAHHRHGEQIDRAVREGVDALAAACRSTGFVAEAIDHRNSRFIAKLSGLPRKAAPGPVTPDTRVRRTDLAFARLIAADDMIDFSQPGGHILVHRGAETSLRYLASEEEFRVGDIPGEIGDDVRVALVQRFIGSGYLETVAE